MTDTSGAELARLVATALDGRGCVGKATVDGTTVRVVLDSGEKFLINVEQHFDDTSDCV